MQSLPVRKRYAQSGYTLIEISVVMLIIGILFSAGMWAYKLYRIETQNQQTELARIRITLAVDAFRDRYGRYPCPASYTAERLDLDYGQETNCTNTSIAAGACGAGYCVENSPRTVTRDDGTTFVPRVRRGAVPFRVLNLTEDEFYDAFGGRFSYAVGENLTDSETFDVSHGGISVVDGLPPDGESLVSPVGSALYFIYSHGRDNVGAYDKNGNEMLPCDGPMYDAENCNTAADALAIYRYAKTSDEAVVLGGSTLPGSPTPPVGVVNTHYDDFAVYKGGDATPIWKMSEVTPDSDNAHDLLDPTETVEIGTASGTEKLRVEGVVRSDDNIQSAEICTNGDCFPSHLIGGSGMACPPGTIMTGVAYDNPICSAPADVTCPNANQYITGFNAQGIPNCVTLASSIFCDPETRTICGEVRNLPRSPIGTVITLTAGASRSRQYRCDRIGNTNNAQWANASGFTGVCTCTPSSNTVTNGPTSCGTGYTGNTTTTTTTVCPSGTSTSTTSRAACVCQPGTETQTTPCTAPATGSGSTRTRNITCSGNTAVFGPWGPWSTPNCTCAARAPQTQALSCPAYHTGTRSRTRNWNTTTCNWDGWVVTDNCVCQGGTETELRACTAPLSGSETWQRPINCPGATPGPWTYVTDNCTCSTSVETRTQPCADPTYTGAITQQRTVDCYGTPVAGAAGNWSNVNDTCTPPPTCAWSTSGASPTSSNTGPVAGASCTCGSAPGNCRVSIGTSGGVTLYQGYTNCRCQ